MAKLIKERRIVTILTPNYHFERAVVVSESGGVLAVLINPAGPSPHGLESGVTVNEGLFYEYAKIEAGCVVRISSKKLDSDWTLERGGYISNRHIDRAVEELAEAKSAAGGGKLPDANLKVDFKLAPAVIK